MARTNNAAIVSAFIKEWDTPAPDARRLSSYFAHNAVYHNIPLAPVSGRDAIEKTLAGMGAGMQSAGWVVTHQVAAGNVVMNERIDRFTSGGKKIEVPVVGVFELQDGLITAWRDYFDLAMFQKQLA